MLGVALAARLVVRCDGDLSVLGWLSGDDNTREDETGLVFGV